MDDGSSIVRTACKSYEKNQRSLFDEKQAARIDNVESIMQRAEKTLNVARARYELVRDLRERPIELLQPLPLQDAYKWECGLVEHDVFKEIDEGKERIKLRNLTGKSDLAYSHWTYSVDYAEFYHREPVMSLTASNANFSPAQEPDVIFRHPNLLLDGGKIFILGWTLSCRRWGGRKSPEIHVKEANNGILAEHLTITLPKSKGEWHCKVLFVLRNDYDFPDLIGTGM